MRSIQFVSAVMLPWFPAQVYFMQTDNLVSRLAIAKDKVGAPLASSNMLPSGCHVTLNCDLCRHALHSLVVREATHAGQAGDGH